MVLTILVCIPLGIIQQLWYTTPIRVEAAITTDIDNEAKMDTAIGYRWGPWGLALQDIRLLGHGYEPSNVRGGTIHNVPLRILYELGPLAATAWIAIIVYLFVKSKRKYIPTAILALALFDHFLWTQLCAYMFVAIGIATRNDSISDYIFRKGES